MKILGRILIILAVFAALSAAMVTAVNASGTNATSFQREGGEFRPGGEMEGFPPAGFRPDGGEGFRHGEFEEHGERGEGRGGVTGLMFGAVKNIGVIGLLVTLIVLPKSIAKKNRKNVEIKSALPEQ